MPDPVHAPSAKRRPAWRAAAVAYRQARRDGASHDAGGGPLFPGKGEGGAMSVVRKLSSGEIAHRWRSCARKTRLPALVVRAPWETLLLRKPVPQGTIGSTGNVQCSRSSMTGAIVQPALFGALSHEDYRIRPDCPVGSRGSCSPGQRTRCQVVLRADGSLLALTLATRIAAAVDMVGNCPSARRRTSQRRASCLANASRRLQWSMKCRWSLKRLCTLLIGRLRSGLGGRTQNTRPAPFSGPVPT